MIRTALLASFALVAGIGAALAAPVSFRCEDGTSMTATFSVPKSGPGTVALAFSDGKRLDLPQVLSADGGRYEADGVEFWTKGRGATLTRQSAATTCSVERK